MYFTETAEGVIVNVRAQPRSSRAGIDGLFGAESGLVDLCVRRAATDTAEHHALYTHRIGGTEDGTDIMLAADVVKHHDQRQFVRLFVLVYIHPPHLGGRQFLTHS